MLPPDRPTRFADLIAETPWLDLACHRCGRAGRLRVSELFAFYGPDELVWTAVEDAAADCPRRGETRIYELCHVRCPTLAEFSRVGIARS